MKRKKLVEKVKTNKPLRAVVSFASAVGRRSVNPNAASIAFYVFISMIPLLILLCSQLPLTGISKSEMTAAVTAMMPETIKGLVSSIISEAYNSRIGMFSLSIIMLLWSSSRGVMALIRSLDIVYEVKESRNIINMYVFSIFYTVCLLLMVSLLLVLYTHELTAEELLRSAMPSNALLDILGDNLKDFDVMFAGTLIAALVFKIAPAGKRRFVCQIPGAAFSAVAISLFSSFFAVYTGGSNIYNSFYGSLTTICIFLMWLYACIIIFLLGGVINSHYSKQINSLYRKIVNRFKARKKLKKELRAEKKTTAAR